MHSPETISQFSTIDAIMLGIYDGPATFGEVKKYGDFGIGTVNHLEGEMVGIDGVFYQITSDGTVHVLPDDAKTSFATVSFFRGEHASHIPKITSLRGIQKCLDSHLGSHNFFWSLSIHGTFASLRARSVTRQHKPYRPLTEVVKSESIFEFRNVTGTLIGFRSPSYIKGINVPGYHLHFLSDDKTMGGHVLGCSILKGIARWDLHKTFQMCLPDDPSFRKADFSEHDEEGLQKAEQ
jgi:acetolactate decarboxylase